jgi:hypothetical protein
MITVLLAASLLGVLDRPATADDVNPEALVTGSFLGTTFTAVGFGRVLDVPEGPAMFSIERVTMEPGAEHEGFVGDIGITLVAVERGELTVLALAPVEITRATEVAETLANYSGFPDQEILEAGAVATLGPGDSVYFPVSAGADLRNETNEEIVLTYVTFAPADFGDGS